MNLKCRIRLKYVFYVLCTLLLTLQAGYSDELVFGDVQGRLLSYNTFDKTLKRIRETSFEPVYLTGYKNLNKINGPKFLFEKTDFSVGVFNIRENKEEIILKNASCPIFLKGVNRFLFTRVEKTADGFEEYLYSSDLNGERLKKLIRLERGTSAKCPIPLNDKQALVYVSYGRDIDVRHFDAVTEKFNEIDFRDLEPVAKIGNARLLCKNEDQYFVTDVNGRVLKTIKSEYLNMRDLMFNSYIKDMNVLIVQNYVERVLNRNIYNVIIRDANTFSEIGSIDGILLNSKGAVFAE